MLCNVLFLCSLIDQYWPLAFSCGITKSITLFPQSGVYSFTGMRNVRGKYVICRRPSLKLRQWVIFLFHVWVNYFVVEIQDFWIGMLCWLVNRYVHLAEAYCLCHRVLGVRLFLDCWALEMLAVPSSQISVAVCQLTCQKTLMSIKTAVRT